MKKLLLATAALLIFSTSANAGDRSCTGTVEMGPKWTTIASVEGLPTCRFKTASVLGKRILRICPNGTDCYVCLSIYDNHRDHIIEGEFMTITKWPECGVELQYEEPGPAADNQPSLPPPTTQNWPAPNLPTLDNPEGIPLPRWLGIGR